MTAGVVIVGSFNQDHVWASDRFPAPGETRLGRFSCGPGGKGFNQAIASVRQGVPTQFIGALGVDAIGDDAARLAQGEGLVAHWQRLSDCATGTAAILLNGEGQNLIVVGPGANAALTVAHVDAHADVIRGARVLLTQNEVNPDATRRAHALARAAGVLVIHNPAPSVALADQPGFADIDLLTPNESEFAQLLRDHAGHDLPTKRIAGQEDAILHQLCRDLGVATVIVTMGPEGAFVSEQTGYARIAAENASVRDTTGAGDAFNGALAAALALGLPLLDAVHRAGCVAALKIERAGAALAMPTSAEVAQRFPA